MTRERELLIDVAPVVVLGLLTFLTGDTDRDRQDFLILLTVALPLLVRRRWPVAVLGIVAIAAAATAEYAAAPWVQVGAVVLASFEVGWRATDRVRSAMAVVAIGGLVTLGFVIQEADPGEVLPIVFAALAPSWLVGDYLRARAVEGARRAEAMERAVREHDVRVRAAAAEERRHVARELHDVLAHAVSVMVIQAGAARQVLRSSPAQAEEAMLAVETVGREAMTELRQFLGALSDDEAAGVAPQPGIRELDALLDRVREAGLPASLEVDGEPRSVPPSLDVAVFRIVQEALTNALKYAGRATTLVRLSWESDRLQVEILDDGPAASAGQQGIGRGLAGMRERASLVGGTLEAGPRVGGGYAVRAWLPLAQAAASEPSPS
jgi:signal transduction histidine kinase